MTYLTFWSSRELRDGSWTSMTLPLPSAVAYLWREEGLRETVASAMARCYERGACWERKLRRGFVVLYGGFYTTLRLALALSDERCIIQVGFLVDTWMFWSNVGFPSIQNNECIAIYTRTLPCLVPARPNLTASGNLGSKWALSPHPVNSWVMLWQRFL